MPSYLLNAAGNLVTMGNVFSTDRSYLYKEPNQFSKQSSFAFTKTLYNPSLQVYRETYEGYTISNFTQIAFRESLPPTVPTKGPFIENYSVDGTLNTDLFINILLIDKPPIRTGFFEFKIGDYSFPGFVTKLISYAHYDWQLTGSKYSYVQQGTDLGYGIEISRNQLYTASLQSDGTYLYTPTPLNVFLNSLNGSEEITSVASTADPNSYLASIPGEPVGTSGTLPINFYYIPAADALRYIASYPSLITSVGADYLKGQQLYAVNGGTITFNPIAYLNKYSDIRALYGYDTYAATTHYITTGYYQGRTITFSSGTDPLIGGLYDERNGSVITNSNQIIWPREQTLAGLNGALTYDYNSTVYYLNESVGVTANLLYLGVQ
jgi:hypothetical protein